MKVSELVDTLNSFIPFKQAFEDDKVGLLIGSDSQDISGVIVAHDLEGSVLNYCIENNINVVISYHPPPIQETLISDNKYVDELHLFISKGTLSRAVLRSQPQKFPLSISSKQKKIHS